MVGSFMISDRTLESISWHQCSYKEYIHSVQKVWTLNPALLLTPSAWPSTPLPPLFIFFFPKPRFWIDFSDNIAPVKDRISTKINSCSKVIYSIDNPFLQENLDAPFPLPWFFKNTNPSINKGWVREGHTMTLHCNFVSMKTSFAEADVKNVSMKL